MAASIVSSDCSDVVGLYLTMLEELGEAADTLVSDGDDLLKGLELYATWSLISSISKRGIF